ncbi:hypothetical protein AAVH_39398, partial [Aphelenchoides avenae]
RQSQCSRQGSRTKIPALPPFRQHRMARVDSRTGLARTSTSLSSSEKIRTTASTSRRSPPTTTSATKTHRRTSCTVLGSTTSSWPTITTTTSRWASRDK